MSTAALWWITLAAGAVVTLVVGVLLAAILRSVRRIAGNLAEAWTVGQSIANNTIHTDLLRRMGVVADDTLASIELSAKSAENIRKVQARSP